MGSSSSSLAPPSKELHGNLARLRMVAQVCRHLATYARRKSQHCYKQVRPKLDRIEEDIRLFEAFLLSEVPKLQAEQFLNLFDDIMLCQEHLMRCFKRAQKLLRSTPALHRCTMVVSTVSSICVDMEDAMWLLRDAVIAAMGTQPKGSPTPQRTACPAARSAVTLQPPAALLGAVYTEEQLLQRTSQAEAGDGEAITELGLLLLFGLGVAPDLRQGVELIKQGARLGIAEAQYWLGRLAEEGLTSEDGLPDMQAAVHSYQAAADRQHAEAAQQLGYMLEHGVQLPANAEAARHYYMLAAQQGKLPTALNNLGRMLLDGRGGQRDAAKACELFAQAAELGSASAMCNLAVCHQTGEGVTTNKSKAIEWLQQAASEHNNARAMTFLGLMKLDDGLLDEAVALLGKAAELGELQAISSLQRIAQLGLQGAGAADVQMKT